MGAGQRLKESSISCRHCDGRMVFMRIKKHEGAWPYFLAGLGFFLSIFLVGPIIGIPMVLIGIYMALASETINMCPKCGYYYKAYLEDTDDGPQE